MTGSGNRLTKLTLALVLGLVAVFTAVDFAEARRAGGGGFGSRGMRTYSTPAPTRTAPNNAAPIERSMTPNTARRKRPVPLRLAHRMRHSVPVACSAILAVPCLAACWSAA